MVDYIEKRVMHETSKDRLREVRKFLGMTQLQFSEVLGIPDKTYSTYENPTRNTKIPLYHLKKLVQKFNINPDYIMMGDGPMILKEGMQINKASNFSDNAYIGSQNNYRGRVEVSNESEWMRKFYQMEGIANERQRLIDELTKKLEECLKKIQ